MMMGFIDTMRSEGHAVESICRVLREQGCQIAARTYRAWRGRHVAARTVTVMRTCSMWSVTPRGWTSWMPRAETVAN